MSTWRIDDFRIPPSETMKSDISISLHVIGRDRSALAVLSLA